MPMLSWLPRLEPHYDVPGDRIKLFIINKYISFLIVINGSLTVICYLSKAEHDTPHGEVLNLEQQTCVNEVLILIKIFQCLRIH